MNAQVKLLLCGWMLARDFSSLHPLTQQNISPALLQFHI